MKNILIFRTATDYVMDNLFRRISNEDGKKQCLVQSSFLSSYQDKYEDITFLDIKKEGFYDLSKDTMDEIRKIYFDIVYVPITGSRAYHFENIMQIIRELNYNKIIFVNQNGDCNEISKMNRFEELFYKCFIQIWTLLYGVLRK